jgi:hypothetical protein
MLPHRQPLAPPTTSTILSPQSGLHLILELLGKDRNRPVRILRCSLAKLNPRPLLGASALKIPASPEQPVAGFPGLTIFLFSLLRLALKRQPSKTVVCVDSEPGHLSFDLDSTTSDCTPLCLSLLIYEMGMARALAVSIGLRWQAPGTHTCQVPSKCWSWVSV